MQIRLFDLDHENPEKLWRLFREVYGTDENARKRWAWEINQHPFKDRIRIHIADEEGAIVGMTIRLPIQLVTDDTEQHAEFAVNTMVHPDYRRHGLVKTLYRQAIEEGNLQLSKGTMPAMVRQLESMGYHDITAPKTLVFLLSPFRWMYQKLTKKNLVFPWSRTKNLPHNYALIDEFTHIPEEVSCEARLSSFRSTKYLNWRYKAIPHRKYECYAHFSGTKTVGWFVLRMAGTTAYLVDLSWIPAEETASNLITAAMQAARNHNAIKMVYWGTLHTLNQEMKRHGAFERPAVPGFRFIARNEYWNEFRWENAHFVQGDGDYDYL
ncbi:GNAT family N-acetyltransferase [Desulfobulbus rhabdoformis]|uniref:GNAT family N-acetyltransferase n=1 Tax=Desulfobulbus rhabdoformis TaxID=34032 RepID=UPI001963D5B3|nr:GNAT family N-acetyltransferase [Desulfobulbus rhabdoformis]MBM9616717.1 GNAT family N-acetyltransferase [Desulfobulbus rhabdoformis]